MQRFTNICLYFVNKIPYKKIFLESLCWFYQKHCPHCYKGGERQSMQTSQVPQDTEPSTSEAETHDVVTGFLLTGSEAM